jgi:hypothetical protein
MSVATAKLTFGTVYVCAIGVTVWNAVSAQSPVMWAVFAAMCLLPPLMLMVMAQSPQKTVAEIIRDAEVGRSL